MVAIFIVEIYLDVLELFPEVLRHRVPFDLDLKLILFQVLVDLRHFNLRDGLLNYRHRRPRVLVRLLDLFDLWVQTLLNNVHKFASICLQLLDLLWLARNFRVLQSLEHFLCFLVILRLLRIKLVDNLFEFSVTLC